MRIVLAIGLFAIGVELPKAYLAKHVRSLLVMVVPTMAFGWLVCGGTVSALELLLSSYAGRLTQH
jgi:NhaP-type Na+/H+ or K+/H+ antiporter